MSPLCALQGRRKSRRIQQQLHKLPLVFDRQANDLGFVDCPVCDLLSAATTKSLTLRPAIRRHASPPERIGRDAGFDTGGADCLLGMMETLLGHDCTGFYLTMQSARGMLADFPELIRPRGASGRTTGPHLRTHAV